MMMSGAWSGGRVTMVWLTICVLMTVLSTVIPDPVCDFEGEVNTTSNKLLLMCKCVVGRESPFKRIRRLDLYQSLTYIRKLSLVELSPGKPKEIQQHRFAKNVTICTEESQIDPEKMAVLKVAFDVHPRNNTVLTFICQAAVFYNNSNNTHIRQWIRLKPSDFYTTTTTTTTTTTSTTTTTPTMTVTTTTPFTGLLRGQSDEPADSINTQEEGLKDGTLMMIVTFSLLLVIVVLVVIVIVSLRRRTRKPAPPSMPAEEPHPHNSFVTWDLLTHVIEVVTSRSRDCSRVTTPSDFSTSLHATEGARCLSPFTGVRRWRNTVSEVASGSYANSDIPSDSHCLSPLTGVGRRGHTVNDSVSEVASGSYANSDMPTDSGDGVSLPFLPHRFVPIDRHNIGSR